MKVAFFTYPSAFQNVGGGEIQLLKTKEYLEKEGVSVHLFDMWKDRIEAYDILHVFSSVKDCLGLVQSAKSRNVKVVLSPVLWSDVRRALFTDGPLRMKVDLTARHLAKVLLPSFPSGRRKLLAEADLLCPNSEIEKDQISRLFAISKEKIRVVYNGVDEEFASASPDLFRSKYGSGNFLLSVGRIEPRKNQLNLIKAVKGIGGKKLVLIGSPVTGYERYFESCRQEGAGFTEFLPTLSHSDPLLRSAYAACSLFILQGWFETPGLAALEAALAGARVVVTQGGSTREYFKELVDYLDPSDPKRMREIIVKNLDAERSDRLRKHVSGHFTWDRIAKHYLTIYKETLSCQPCPS